MAATRIFNGKLTANQVEAVSPSGGNLRKARILNVDGADRIYIRGDGVDPVAPWDDCEMIPATIGYLVIALHVDKTDGIPEVRLASPGTPEYQVKFFG